jgi:ankyrin repeat protein
VGARRLAANAGDKLASYPALRLARDGDLVALQALAGAALVVADRHGSSALHWAAGAGQLEVVQWLIEEKVCSAAGAQGSPSA